MEKKIVIYVLCFFVLKPLSAKTPAQRVTEFAAILPPNTKALVAWLAKATDGNLTIHVTDSDSGIIRELTPPSIFPSKKRGLSWFHPPLITSDGSRVVFKESTSNTFYTIGWDGSALRSFSCNGDFPAGYWHDKRDNSDWIIHTSPIYRTNIDKPVRRMLLWSNSGTVWPGWFTLSEDGTRVGMSQGSNQIVGIAVVPNGKFTAGDTLGCRCSIAPDNSYDFIFQTPYHKLLRMCDSNGVRKQDFVFNDTIIAWAKANNVFIGGLLEHDNIRWSNHRDYIIFYMNCTNVNPFIMRLSDRAWMYIEDNVSGYSSLGCGDLRILSRDHLPPAKPVISTVPDIGCQVYRPLEIYVFARGRPDPALSATGLPSGLKLLNDTIWKEPAIIAGTPSDTGRFVVVLTATNTAGTDKDTFTIKIGIYNDTPFVYAGKDTAIRMGSDFRLYGIASDDGIINKQLKISWKQISGPDSGATIANPSSLSSTVTFSKAGDYHFRLTADDGAIAVSDTVMISVAPPLPFVVLRPREGQQVFIGGIDTISWQLDPPAEVFIELSTDNGMNFAALSEGNIPAGTTTWVWNVSDTLQPSDSCFIRIKEYMLRSVAISRVFRLVSAVGTREYSRSKVSPFHEIHNAAIRIYTINGRLLSATNGTATAHKKCESIMKKGVIIYCFQREGEKSLHLVPVVR